MGSYGKGERFTLVPLKEEELDEACALCDECVGRNLYKKEDIKIAFEDRDKHFLLLKDEKGKTAGYIYYGLSTDEEIANYAKIDVNLIRRIYPSKGKIIGKMQSIGVKSEYRGEGLSAFMINFVTDRLKKQSAGIVFCVCWKPMGIVSVQKALKECDFSFLTEAKKIWYDDVDLVCPYCKGRCVCDADVYYKILEEVTDET